METGRESWTSLNTIPGEAGQCLVWLWSTTCWGGILGHFCRSGGMLHPKGMFQCKLLYVCSNLHTAQTLPVVNRTDVHTAGRRAHGKEDFTSN